MSAVWNYLPTDEGLLPKWLFLVGIVAIGNSLQTYSTLYFNKRIYSAQPDQVTGLSSRTFGTWTFLTAVIRIYGAFNLSNPAMYDICFWTYGIAFAHFMSELLVFKTASFKGEGLYFPIGVASISLIWFYMQRSAYLGL